MRGFSGVTRRAAPFLAVALAAVLLSWFKVVDYDVFWHLKTGQVILETGRLVHANTFSAQFPDHPWSNPEWLFQVLLAVAHRAGGWLGVQAFKVLLVALLAVALAARALAAGVRPPLAVASTLVVLAAMRFRFQERPQLFSYLFFALVVAAVERARRGNSRALWLLPPLFALWSNVHPELFVGLLYLGGGVAGELLQRRATREPSAGARTPLAALAATAAACTAAALLSPEGYRVLALPFRHFLHGPIVTLSEFVATSPAALPPYWALAVAAIPALLFKGPRRDWAEIIPAAGLGVLGAIYLRETPYFLIATATVIPLGLHALEGSVPWLTRRRAAAIMGVAGAAALLWAFRWDRLQPYRWGWGIDDDLHPVAPARVLLAEPWQGNLFNNLEQGGYLIFTVFPRYGVLQDGRGPAYPEEFLARLNAKLTARDWPRIVADYDLNLALVYAKEAAYFDPGEWGVAYWDEAWALLARRTRRNAPLLYRREYRLFLPGRDFAAGADRARLEGVAAEMARNAGERLRASPELANNLGSVLLRLGRLPQAEAWLREAVRLRPGLTAAWTNLGLLLAEAGREQEAAEALDRALDLEPRQPVVRARREMLRRR